MRIRWSSVFAVVFVFALLGIGIRKLIFSGHHTVTEGTRQISSDDAPSIGTSCEIDKDTGVMTDGTMAGLIEQGSTYTVFKNYYACHRVQAGDVVLYRFSSKFPPVPRIVRAVPGNKFKLVKDPSKKAWNIQVDGATLMYEGKPHFFGVGAPPILALYEKSFKGVLPQNVFILFSNVPPGEIDSANFGVMSLSDIIGKVDVRSQGPIQPVENEEIGKPKASPTPEVESDE